MLNRLSVGKRVTERHPDFDHIRPRTRKGLQNRDGGSLDRILRRDVGDQRFRAG